MNKLPTVAIVGEPNAGKSTLLNKIAKAQIAVTSKVPGTTRDRQYLDTEWNGVDFTLIDTAGITFGNKQELEDKLTKQIDVAFDEADLILFVVDSKLDPTIIDRQALIKFRKSSKPIILAINKLDSPTKLLEHQETQGAEFKKLGIKNIAAISAATGRGVGDLLDQIAEQLKDIKVEPLPKPLGIAVSLVGKPNVGKSSLINRILGEDRVIVSDLPGTTRTAIDIHAVIDNQDYTFIDTAGMKRKQHRQKQPDVFSVYQTFKSIRRSEVVIFVIDAIEPISKQDQVIAGAIHDLRKGVIILANKYDLYSGDQKALEDYIRHFFPFLWYAPIMFSSAETGFGVEDLIKAIKPIDDNREKEIPQEELDRLLAYAQKTNPPQRLRDQKPPKIYNLVQTGHRAPMFDLMVARPPAISQAFRRYLYKQIIQKLGFWGTAIKLNIVKEIKPRQ
ncbi:MAG: ribosome biogenesis GTPase Der [Candidatus Doudnabacteria bacterium]